MVSWRDVTRSGEHSLNLEEVACVDPYNPGNGTRRGEPLLEIQERVCVSWFPPRHPLADGNPVSTQSDCRCILVSRPESKES